MTTQGILSVARATDELRRGQFIIVDGVAGPMVALAAEALTRDRLDRLRAMAPTRLAITTRRAHALGWPTVGATVVSIPIGDDLDLERIRQITDPTIASNGAIASVQGFVAEPNDSVAGAAIALSKQAGMLPAAVVAAPVNGVGFGAVEDGAHLLHVTHEAVLAYPNDLAVTLAPISEARVPMAGAEDARVVGFRPADGSSEQLAIVIGDPAANQPALCRLHSECFTGDLLGSLRCDCGPQLQAALRQIGAAGHGILLYLAQEGRGIGLINKLRAYNLQDLGLDTVDANQHLGFEPDERSYRFAAAMLRNLGIERVRLLTNNPSKVAALVNEGVVVAERLPLSIDPNRHNRTYLATKASRSGHWL